MLDINESPSYKYIYGELNNKIKKKLYKGLDTNTAKVNVNNISDIISVDVNSPFSYIKKLKSFTYEALYENLDYNFAEHYFYTTDDKIEGSCSVVRNGNLVGRNFDWTYDNSVTFRIITPNKNGRYATIGCTNGPKPLTQEFVDSNKYDDAYIALPFRIMDGMNECGLFVECNVVPTDHGVNDDITPNMTIEKTLPAIMLNRYILDNFKTASEAVNYIINHVKIVFRNELHKLNYETHWMICDETNTYILEVVNNQYQIKNDNTDFANNIMTNFHKYDVALNSDKTVYTPVTQDSTHDAIITNRITDHGDGLERYNYIVNNYNNTNTLLGMQSLMQNIKYTNTYTKPIGNDFWYTEYVGGDYKVNTSTDKFNQILPIFIEQYNNRSRNNPITWQTIHTTIYDIHNKKMYLFTQEDYDNMFEYQLNPNNLLWSLGEGLHSIQSDTCLAKADYSISTGYQNVTLPGADFSSTAGYRTTTNGQASHADGAYTKTNNIAEFAIGRGNKSNKNSNTFGDSGNTLFSAGIGGSDVEDSKNGFEIMQNGDMYVLGLGGYDGTNANAPGILPIQQIINN